jgi:tetratricopeptide (TPR) repeat protein
MNNMNKDDLNIIHRGIHWTRCTREMEACRKTMQEHPDLDPPKLALARASINFVHAALAHGNLEKTMDAVDEALELLGDLMSRDEGDTVLSVMAEARSVRSLVLMRLGYLDESLADTLEAIRLQKDVWWRAEHRLAAAGMLWVLWRHKRKLLALSRALSRLS